MLAFHTYTRQIKIIWIVLLLLWWL